MSFCAAIGAGSIATASASRAACNCEGGSGRQPASTERQYCEAAVSRTSRNRWSAAGESGGETAAKGTNTSTTLSSCVKRSITDEASGRADSSDSGCQRSASRIARRLDCHNSCSLAHLQCRAHDEQGTCKVSRSDSAPLWLATFTLRLQAPPWQTAQEAYSHAFQKDADKYVGKYRKCFAQETETNVSKFAVNQSGTRLETAEPRCARTSLQPFGAASFRALAARFARARTPCTASLARASSRARTIRGRSRGCDGPSSAPRPRCAALTRTPPAPHPPPPPPPPPSPSPSPPSTNLLRAPPAPMLVSAARPNRRARARRMSGRRVASRSPPRHKTHNHPQHRHYESHRKYRKYPQPDRKYPHASSRHLLRSMSHRSSALRSQPYAHVPAWVACSMRSRPQTRPRPRLRRRAPPPAA
eukprot:6198131-Pleurochrysis_carterae.AAC.1